MKKDFNFELKAIDGKPLIDGDKPIVAKDIIIGALVQPKQGQSGSDAFKKYQLAEKVQADAQDYELDELKLIKDSLDNIHPLALGPIWKLLNE